MKSVLVIQTGGTIMMQSALREPGSVSADPDLARGYLKKEVPELSTIANIDVLELFYEDSSSLSPAHWTKLANTIILNKEKYDGFVVLHGTDTMAYTASALSYALIGLNKPVVFTGSQVPLTTLRSDARRNLINSVEIATFDIPEVCVCFNDNLFRGNRSTKMSIGDFDAFASPNLLPLAEIGLNIKFANHILPSVDVDKFQPNFEASVYVVKLFPGLKPTLLNPLIDSGVKAILIEGFGSGNFPIKGDYNLTSFLETCTKNGIILAMCSQAPFDAIDLSKYESGRMAIDLGVLSSGAMTLEASTVKLMHLLAGNYDLNMIKLLYQKNLAGELN
jgi:L-asparaginase